MNISGGYNKSYELQGHTKESLTARYRNSTPGSAVESNEHVDAARLINDTMTLELNSKGLIGEDCGYTEKDVPGEIITVNPKLQQGHWGREEARLEYDPGTQKTKQFVDTVTTPGQNVTLTHTFEDGNEIFRRIQSDSTGRRETTVICQATGKPIELKEAFTPGPQLHSNASGGLAMF